MGCAASLEPSLGDPGQEKAYGDLHSSLLWLHPQGLPADRGGLRPGSLDAEIDLLSSTLAELNGGRGHVPRRPERQVTLPLLPIGTLSPSLDSQTQPDPPMYVMCTSAWRKHGCKYQHVSHLRTGPCQMQKPVLPHTQGHFHKCGSWSGGLAYGFWPAFLLRHTSPCHLLPTARAP